MSGVPILRAPQEECSWASPIPAPQWLNIAISRDLQEEIGMISRRAVKNQISLLYTVH